MTTHTTPQPPDPRDAELADLRAQLGASEARCAAQEAEIVGLRDDRDALIAAATPFGNKARLIRSHLGDDQFTDIQVTHRQVRRLWAVLTGLGVALPPSLRALAGPRAVPKPGERKAS